MAATRKRWLPWHGRSAEPVRSAADLRPGRVTMAGMLATATPLLSPISGALCAGYHYSASCYRTVSRSRGRSRVRDITVYAPGLSLQLADGSVVALETPQEGFFGPGEHLLLEGMDYLGFRSQEMLLDNESQVQIVGRLARVDAEWTLRVLQIQDLES